MSITFRASYVPRYGFGAHHGLLHRCPPRNRLVREDVAGPGGCGPKGPITIAA